jgi:hypothetical protein
MLNLEMATIQFLSRSVVHTHGGEFPNRDGWFDAESFGVQE